MKTIGLLGGMTCESSVEYYRFINEEYRKQVKQDEGEIPLFDTTLLHAHAAVGLALE